MLGYHLRFLLYNKDFKGCESEGNQMGIELCFKICRLGHIYIHDLENSVELDP